MDSFIVLLTVMFVGLKLTNHVEIDWIVCMSPLIVWTILNIIAAAITHEK